MTTPDRAALPPLDPAVRDALLDPAAYPHGVERVELIETHISCVFLAGDWVYKLKKPVVLDFVDFGTLSARRHFCEEEIRLNRPWAPEIYDAVVPVTADGDGFALGGDGEPVEYAVRMRRFDQGWRLDRQLAAGSLSVDDMRELGDTVAERHETAEHAAAGERGRLVRAARAFIEENFPPLEGALDAEAYRALRDWTDRELVRVDAAMHSRFDAGWTRDCHGDLHLGNLVRLPSGITTFDCIEFNPDLGMIDVQGDLSFLVMDLVSRGRADLAALLMNRYLERTGDYGGMAVFDLYFVYRCLVRAKVALLRSQEVDDEAERRASLDEMHRYADLARDQTRRRAPGLVLMHGLSGSGKTRVSSQLMAALPAIRIRSDVERKRLAGLDAAARSGSSLDGGIYTADATSRTYDRLIASARAVVEAGHRAILDATFLDAGARGQVLALAAELEVPAAIVSVEAPVEVLRERLRRRAEKTGEASEADERVLDHQLATQDELSADERRRTVRWDSTAEVDADELVAAVRTRLESSPRR